MPDQGGDEAERPHQADGEHRQHDEGLAQPAERREQQPQREHEGQPGRELAVVERGAHAVGRERGAAGHTGLEPGELGREPGDLAANLVDGGEIVREPATAAGGIGEHVEQRPIVGQEVPCVLVQVGGREHRHQRRSIRCRMPDRLA